MKIPEVPSSHWPKWRPDRRQGVTPNPKATLREPVHEVMRFFNYSERMEAAHWQRIERWRRSHKRGGVTGPAAWRHPRLA